MDPELLRENGWPSLYIDIFSGQLERVETTTGFIISNRNLMLACCAYIIETRGTTLIEDGLPLYKENLPERFQPAYEGYSPQRWVSDANRAAREVGPSHRTTTNHRQILSGLNLGDLYYMDIGPVERAA